MKTITIISVFGHRNKGDAGIFSGLLTHLKRLFPEAEISAIVRYPETERGIHPEIQIEEQLLRTRSRWRAFKIVEMIWFVSGFVAWFFCRRLGTLLLPERKRAAIEALARGDLVLSCGGGFLHDSFPGFVVHLFEMYMTQRLNKPLILVGQSIGPFRKAWAQRLACVVLEGSDRILARERISLQYLQETFRLPPSKIGLIPDLAFTWEPGPEQSEVQEPAETTGMLGVTVRHWNFPEKASQSQELNATFQDKLSRLLDLLVEITDLRVIFFPQAITPDFNALDDRSVARNVASRMKYRATVTLIEDDLPVPRLRKMIGRCTLFVGTRMHSNIFALTAGVPTLAISYLPKTRGIMEFLGLGELVVEMEDDFDEFVVKARRLVESQDEIRALLQKRIPEVQSCIGDTLFEAIHEIKPL